MPQTRAILLEEKSVTTILNSGADIFREDLEAELEHAAARHEKRYLLLDYKDPQGAIWPWATVSNDYFLNLLTWTEPEKTGFRHCRLK